MADSISEAMWSMEEVPWLFSGLCNGGPQRYTEGRDILEFKTNGQWLKVGYTLIHQPMRPALTVILVLNKSVAVQLQCPDLELSGAQLEFRKVQFKQSKIWSN